MPPKAHSSVAADLDAAVPPIAKFTVFDPAPPKPFPLATDKSFTSVQEDPSQDSVLAFRPGFPPKTN